jgi:RNA polymerase sigma-70 factor (ECF subfamily)
LEINPDLAKQATQRLQAAGITNAQVRTADACANGFAACKADGPFEAWLRRITVNDCLDRIRKQKGIWMVQLEEHAEENHDPIQSSYSQAYLQSLIDALPLGYKTVFNLFAIEGYNHQEIAERLKISESTSKSQLSRARQYLQKQLQVYAAKTNKL